MAAFSSGATLKTRQRCQLILQIYANSLRAIALAHLNVAMPIRKLYAYTHFNKGTKTEENQH